MLLTATLSISSAAVFDRDGNHIPDWRAWSGHVDWEVVTPQDDLSGIGVLAVWPLGDVCTASLLDSGPDDGPAYVLTNAHCNFFEHLGTDPLDPDEHRLDQPTSYHMVFNHYVDVPRAQRIQLPLRRLAYITEHHTDVALYELEASLGEVRELGLVPLALTSEPPEPGDRVALVGVPLLYVPGALQSLHRSYCDVQQTVVLRNGDYLAPDSVVHQCSSLPGFSGGPLLSAEHEILLLNSHGVDETLPLPDCTYESRPCEVLPDGSTEVRPERNYAQHVHGIGSCFDERGRFGLELPGCALPGGPGPVAPEEPTATAPGTEPEPPPSGSPSPSPGPDRPPESEARGCSVPGASPGARPWWVLLALLGIRARPERWA